MDENNLAQLEEDINQRIMYQKGSDEYNEYINSIEIIDFDWQSPSTREILKNIDKEMYIKLKEKYDIDNNNAFYQKITFALPKIEEMITNKATELSKLPTPIAPSISQRIYSGISRKQNTADKAMDEYNKQEKNIMDVIKRLKNLKDKINTLLPIYAPQQTAGNRKTRINKNKNKKGKTIKKQHKSKRR